MTFHGNPMYFGGVPSTGKGAYLRRTEQISAADFVGCVKSLTVNGHERRLFTDSFNATGIRDTCNQVCVFLRLKLCTQRNYTHFMIDFGFNYM